MIELAPGQATPALRALFRTEGHAFRRAFAVMDGTSGGRILTDDPDSPSWAAVHELSSDGVLYLEGALARELVAEIIERLRRERVVTVGLASDDPRRALLPGNATWQGIDVEFEDRDPGVDLERLVDPPSDLRMARIDREIEPRTIWTPWMFADGRTAVEQGIGYCLLDGDRVASEAYAGPVVDGVLEMAVITDRAYQRHGLGKTVSARTILECERLGYLTWWNTSLENVGSAGIARAMGYRTERQYPTWVWGKADG